MSAPDGAAMARAFAELEAARADMRRHQLRVRRAVATFVGGPPILTVGFHLGGIFVVIGTLGIALTILGVALGFSIGVLDEDAGSKCRRRLHDAERVYGRMVAGGGAT